MARRIPTAETHLIHPAISVSLLAALIAATIAIVAALCGDRRASPPSSPSSLQEATEKLELGSSPTMVEAAVSIQPSPGTADTAMEAGDEKEKQSPLEGLEPLPLPPIRRVNETSPNHMPRSASVAQNRGGGFMVSPSIKIPRSLSVAKHLPFTKEERLQRRRDKSKQSDSVWMKTIILGEKCRVPDGVDDLYDDKGQKFETFHPKGPRSLPVSRTNSFDDPEDSSLLSGERERVG